MLAFSVCQHFAILASDVVMVEDTFIWSLQKSRSCPPRIATKLNLAFVNPKCSCDINIDVLHTTVSGNLENYLTILNSHNNLTVTYLSFCKNFRKQNHF